MNEKNGGGHNSSIVYIFAGFFCSAESQGQNKVYFRHKQFQEYFAAAYLTISLSHDPWLRNATATNQTEMTLFDASSSIPWLLSFAFGLSPAAAVEILQALQPRLCVANFGTNIDIDYEARLNCEADDAVVTKHLIEAIASAAVVERYEFGNHCPTSELIKLCREFSHTQKVQLLQKWFGISLMGSEGNWLLEVQNQEDNDPNMSTDKVLELKSFSIVLYTMLSQFTFPDVQKLSCQGCFTNDIYLLLKLFPNVRSLFLESDFTFDSIVESSFEQTAFLEEKQHLFTIKEVVIKCDIPGYIICRSPKAIVRQCTLTKLVFMVH